MTGRALLEAKHEIVVHIANMKAGHRTLQNECYHL
jgi:hypothetical protein